MKNCFFFKWHPVKLHTATHKYKIYLPAIDGLAVCLSGSFVWCVWCFFSSSQLTALCEVSLQRPSLSGTVVWTASPGCFLAPGVEWSVFAFSQTLRVEFLMMLLMTVCAAFCCSLAIRAVVNLTLLVSRRCNSNANANSKLKKKLMACFHVCVNLLRHCKWKCAMVPQSNNFSFKKITTNSVLLLLSISCLSWLAHVSVSCCWV